MLSSAMTSGTGGGEEEEEEEEEEVANNQSSLLPNDGVLQRPLTLILFIIKGPYRHK